ncbi:unnamed protein product [Psylliodes chrysocephalus]|uniref:Zinc finger MYM-type protein 1-like n=1 Tax=Psylliodes chrysocephalus TaxID=3402493 RepID=A0A9P0GH39_9CUCU|nr:unnamed protein product [Psylliodes chrysocephala]
MDECRCVIDQLLEKPFSLYHFAEKKEIIENGRPTPILNDFKKESKKVVRYFKFSWYSENSWLCGCMKNRLYCWPCLLFSTEKNGWTSSGVNDLNSFRALKRRHEISPLHVRCVANLIQFGKTRIESCLNQAFKANIAKYNEIVKNNRYIVSTLIDAVCYLAKQELPFRGHFEGDDSDNRGNYRELLTLIAKKDQKFCQHLETSTVFSGVSSDIQNDIIEAISTFVMDEIKSEIAGASFVAVILDESTDVSNQSQLSVVFRYVCPDGDVCERFLKFVNVSDERSAGPLSEILFSVLNEFKCGNKLIAQTYDGAAVMSGQHNGLQKLVRDKYQDAIFVHCYAHRLNLVLQQSVEHIRECKIFFQTLSGLAAFFSKSSKRAAALDKLVQKRLPKVASTRWIYTGRLVEVVSCIRSELLELFKEMHTDTATWDGETRICSKGFYITLQEFDFNFFLNLFEIILPKSEILFDILQKTMYDIGFCTRKVNEFLEFLQLERKNFESLWLKQEKFVNDDVSKPNKRQRITNINNDKETSYRRLFFEIFDTMIIQLKNRFSDLKHLECLALYDFDNFKNYAKKFPDSAFHQLLKLYGQKFDTVKLKTELTVLYNDPDYVQKNLQAFYQYLKSSELDSAFPEAFKLANLFLTIPATSASVERSFSAMKRIKTCQRNTQLQDRMSSLSLISIEKRFLNGLMAKPSFYDSVINIFANKENRRIDLKYKQ